MGGLGGLGEGGRLVIWLKHFNEHQFMGFIQPGLLV